MSSPSTGLFAGLHMASTTEEEPAPPAPTRQEDVPLSDDSSPVSANGEDKVVEEEVENGHDEVASGGHDDDDDNEQKEAPLASVDVPLNETDNATSEPADSVNDDEAPEIEDIESIDDDDNEPVVEAPAASYSYFSGWFGGSAAPPKEESTTRAPPADTDEESHARSQVDAVIEATDDNEPVAETTAETTTEPVAELSTETTANTTPNEDEGVEKQETSGDPVDSADNLETKKPVVEDEDGVVVPTQEAAEPAATEPEEEEPTKKEMPEEEKKALEEAFSQSASDLNKDKRDSTTPSTLPKPATITGLGYVPGPVPHSHVAHRILRKFAQKTRPRITVTYGGARSRGLFGYLFGSNKQDATFVPYRELMDVLFEEGEDRDMKDHDSEREAEAGEGGEARACQSVGAFVSLFSVWGHASSRYMECKEKKAKQDFSFLMSALFDAASELVAHGCLDDVQMCIGVDGSEVQRVIHILAQSVYNSDLTLERNELSALKFLLGTGCRVAPSGDALLHGSHLLQAVRVLYHVYLTTESSPNKTTARAALQQLTTSVFARVVRTDSEEQFDETSDHFPSENHRDAFLVLRSICKLSMRVLPDSDPGAHSHVGLQSSGSNEFWDERHDAGVSGVAPPRVETEMDNPVRQGATAELIYTSAVHPALESKLLALELILYVLQNTKFTKSFITRSGVQFHTAIRRYLCVSLLKNCTSDNTRVVNLSLRIFVPLVRNFRILLKNEIEAFVTNVFFVILDSKHSSAEHKSIVVKTFEEICSDPTTLAEIFLNYDCDLSAVDLFHRIVNTLSVVSRSGLGAAKSGGLFMGSQGVSRMEKLRNENRDLRLVAMKALRQVLASLHASIVKPMASRKQSGSLPNSSEVPTEAFPNSEDKASENGQQNLVEMYGSKKKRRAEEAEATTRFNQKPSAGIAYAVKCGHVAGDDPADVARYLWKNKDEFDKTQIGEYLGREPDYQNGFSLKVLHEYARLMDFTGLVFDDAIRYFLSGFRLPGEAQKIDRIMEKFAERFTEQNPSVFHTADVAFILAFSIIMLNTDLHNPAIKEERRMTKEGFIRNNRGISDGQDLPNELLSAIFDRIKENPISLKEDDDARERVGDGNVNGGVSLPAALSPASFFTSHYEEDRARESSFQKERDHIVRTTESLLKRRRHHGANESTKQSQKARTGRQTRQTQRFVLAKDTGLKDEYVSPMFDVTWGPALAAFSTAMESANGTLSAAVTVVSDVELELAVENAAETIEVCLTGFRFAIGTAGLCGNLTARDAYMLALGGFTQLGTGVLLEFRHIRCIQTMLSLARDDGELIGTSWEHVFRSLSEVNRFHQLFHLMARNDRKAAAATEHRRKRLEAREARQKEIARRREQAEDGESILSDATTDDSFVSDEHSLASDIFDEDDDLFLEDELDPKAIDEANAKAVYEAVSERLIEAIYERSSSLSSQAIKDFISQLCEVSKMEVTVGIGRRPSARTGSEPAELTKVAYREQHQLLGRSSHKGGPEQFHHRQPNIYNLQKLVEVTHYNMDSRPRLVFAELWTLIADHLSETSLHDNPAIAMYAVDSFRQLSIQYLRRDELEVFEFQKRFLKPLEAVMRKSQQPNTKELLLNCVGRLIQVFGGSNSEKGGLRSGWVPLLEILGLGGGDREQPICELSFDILRTALDQSLSNNDHPKVLVSEHFVEAVNTLFRFVEGPHVETSLSATQAVLRLVGYLTDSESPLPIMRRRSSTTIAPETSKQNFEHWWPILLGFSRSVGDARLQVRTKSLECLEQVISLNFFPTQIDGEATEHLQTLQLIFRGILMPVLEFAEGQDGKVALRSIQTPSELNQFLQHPNATKEAEEEQEEQSLSWLDTTFDPFVDLCVVLCLRSVSTYDDPSLVDEMFALFNTCMVSESGAVAVRGLLRLEQFITSDMDVNMLSDEVWATVCHVLRGCLGVTGLPNPETSSDDDIAEFVAEQTFTSSRRFVGSNAISAVGHILTSEVYGVTLRWRLFLVAGLSRGIVQWDQSSSLLEEDKVSPEENSLSPPFYMETAMYGRKWMNRLLLQLASVKEIAQASSEADPKTDREAAGQKLVLDETQRLLTKYLEIERQASEYNHTPLQKQLLAKYFELVMELLTGFQNMGRDLLEHMAWLTPVLLGSCIQVKNEDIRLMVQKLVRCTTPGSVEPYPTPQNSMDKDDEPEPDTEIGRPDADERNQPIPGDGEDEGESQDQLDGNNEQQPQADEINEEEEPQAELPVEEPETVDSRESDQDEA